jgi:hypothetical protein
MPKLPPQDQALEIAQRRAHRLEALPKLDERPLEELLGKPGLQEPRPQVRIVPSIESDLCHMIVLEHVLQALGDELIIDRCARRRFEVALLGPQVIGRTVVRRLLRQPLKIPGGMSGGTDFRRRRNLCSWRREQKLARRAIQLRLDAFAVDALATFAIGQFEPPANSAGRKSRHGQTIGQRPVTGATRASSRHRGCGASDHPRRWSSQTDRTMRSAEPTAHARPLAGDQGVLVSPPPSARRAVRSAPPGPWSVPSTAPD